MPSTERLRVVDDPAKRLEKILIVRCCLFIVALSTSFVIAAEPGAPLGEKGELLREDDLNRAELGDLWRFGRGIMLNDGHITAEHDGGHPVVTRTKVSFRDAIIELKIRFRGAKSVSFMYDDKETAPTTHAGHLARVTVSPTVLRLGDDKEGGMRLDILALKNSGDPADLTKREKLLVGRTAEVPLQLEQDRWYKLTIELVGDELRGSIDDKPLVRLKSPGIAHEIKTRVRPQHQRQVRRLRRPESLGRQEMMTADARGKPRGYRTFFAFRRLTSAFNLLTSDFLLCSPRFARISAASPFATLAKQYGTPTYVYDEATIVQKINDLKAFDVVRFAQKACSNIAILDLVRRNGVLVDAVSAGEIHRAMKAGYAPHAASQDAPPPIVFTADLFDRETLDLVVKHDIHVNCGSPDMLEQYGARKPGANVTLRINPGFGHGHSQKTNTGGEQSKHGIWHEQTRRRFACSRADAGQNQNHRHCIMHIGSAAPTCDHLSQVCGSMETVVGKDRSRRSTTISAGGGLPTIRTTPSDIVRRSSTKYFHAMWDASRKRLEKPSSVTN